MELCVYQIEVGNCLSFQYVTRFLLVLFQKSKKCKPAESASQQDTAEGNVTVTNCVQPSES